MAEPAPFAPSLAHPWLAAQLQPPPLLAPSQPALQANNMCLSQYYSCTTHRMYMRCGAWLLLYMYTTSWPALALAWLAETLPNVPAASNPTPRLSVRVSPQQFQRFQKHTEHVHYSGELN